MGDDQAMSYTREAILGDLTALVLKYEQEALPGRYDREDDKERKSTLASVAEDLREILKRAGGANVAPQDFIVQVEVHLQSVSAPQHKQKWGNALTVRLNVGEAAAFSQQVLEGAIRECLKRAAAGS